VNTTIFRKLVPPKPAAFRRIPFGPVKPALLHLFILAGVPVEAQYGHIVRANQKALSLLFRPGSRIQLAHEHYVRFRLNAACGQSKGYKRNSILAGNVFGRKFRLEKQRYPQAFLDFFYLQVPLQIKNANRCGKAIAVVTIQTKLQP